MIERMIGWSPISNSSCNDPLPDDINYRIDTVHVCKFIDIARYSHQSSSLCVVLKVKLADCSAHIVLSVKAVMVTVYSVTASRPVRVSRASVVSPTADVLFCQSMRYMKDHMSGVVGRSHCNSTMGGTGLASLGLRGGPGQAVGERVKRMQCTHLHRLY